MKKSKTWKPDKKNEGHEVKYYYFRMHFRPEIRAKLGDIGMSELDQRIKLEAKAVREKVKGWVEAACEC